MPHELNCIIVAMELEVVVHHLCYCFNVFWPRVLKKIKNKNLKRFDNQTTFKDIFKNLEHENVLLSDVSISNDEAENDVDHEYKPSKVSSR